jgi:glycine/D-amino acid oxidase-like deaminating enzyme
MSNAIKNSALWEDDVERLHFPALDANLEVDLCVVGLGASGLRAAMHAAERGLKVVGIDAGVIAGAAAGRNGGLLLAGTADFYNVACARLGNERAAKVYQHTLDEMAHVLPLLEGNARMTGVLRTEDTDEGLAEATAHFESLRRDGFPVEMYDGPQGQGILIPTNGSFHPVDRAMRFARLAVQMGVQLCENTAAVSVTSNEVRTTSAVISAKHVLVATDGFLKRAIPELANGVRQVRLQMIATAPDAIELKYPSYTHFGYDYWQQRPDGRVALGGGRHQVKASEFTDKDEPTQALFEYLEKRLRGLGVTAEITHHWAAIVSYSDNEQPIAREVTPDVWGLGAFNGTGNVIGTLLGRALVDQMIDGRSQILTDFYDL